jgi:hypothetical protein
MFSIEPLDRRFRIVYLLRPKRSEKPTPAPEGVEQRSAESQISLEMEWALILDDIYEYLYERN